MPSMTWAITWILLTSVLYLLGWNLWWIRVERRALIQALTSVLEADRTAQHSRWQELANDWHALADRVGHLQSGLGSLESSLSSRLQSLTESLHEYLTSVQKDEAAWKSQVGAFAPSDETAAAQERLLNLAEDRFISAHGPIRYSSAGSRILAKESATAALTRRVKPSGRKS